MSLPKIKSTSALIINDGVAPLMDGGRSYQLSDSRVPHHLPQPSKLKPYVDRIAGEMETWPANSNLMSTSQVKPTFLQKLEAYLSRELYALGVSDKKSVASEKRLQAFREVFEYLIDEFRTYKPILSSIKQEYEGMISAQKETIKSLEPLKAMLVNVNEQCEQKVSNLKQNEKKDLENANKKIVQLDDVILMLKEEIRSLNQQVKKCQDEVKDIYKKYRDESDSKKLLIQTLNDLKYQQEDSKKVAAGGVVEVGQEEDPVFLRIALKKAREDLELKNHKLAEVMADYGDVVPRRDFEKMEVEFLKIQEEFETLQKDHDVLGKEHTALIDIHKKVVEQRDSFASDCERMRVSATPRPDWNRCGFFIEGGQERWQDLTTGTSTSDKVDILLAEMTGQDLEAIRSGEYGINDYFEPRGTAEDVPPYLQSSEKVRNRRLLKHDLMIIIKEIWQQKMKEEGNAPFTQHSPMQSFLLKFLKERYSTEELVVEWGYNIDDALLRFNADPNASVFNSILHGDLDEDIYYDNLTQLQSLYNTLTSAATSGTITKEDFQTCLTKQYPYLSPDDLTNLMESVEEEVEVIDNTIGFQDLFSEDSGGGTGSFLTLIQQMWREDREKFLREIEGSLSNVSQVSREELGKIFLSVSPSLSEELRGKYTSLGFGESSESGLSVEVVLANLWRSCVRRM